METWKKLGLIFTSGLVLVACGNGEDAEEIEEETEVVEETEDTEEETDEIEELDSDDEEETEDVEEEEDDDRGLLGGGSDDDTDDVSEEEWAQALEESLDSLESYASDVHIDILISVGPDIMQDQDEDWITTYIVGDFEEGYSTSENDEGQTTELYFEGNDVYVVEEDGWNYYPDEGPVNYDSGYPDVVESILEVQDFIEATESGGDIELYYEGNDREIWNAFEEEFSLSIDGIEEEDIVMTLEATIDGDTLYLEDFSLDIIGEQREEGVDDDVELGRIEMSIEADFYDHDEVDLTDIREDIEAELNN